MILQDDNIIAAKQSLANATVAITRLGKVLDGAEFVECITIIDECQGHVYVSGVGASGAIAKRLAHLLRLIGIRCSYLAASDALHGGLGGVRAADVLLVISKGGQSAELNEVASACRTKGTAVVAFTSRADSELSAMARLVLTIPLGESLDHGGAIATASGIAHAALGDALVVGLHTRRGRNWQAVADAHPAGLAGNLLRGKVADIDE